MPRLLALTLILAACGSEAVSDDGPITGSIAADQTWSGTRELRGFVTIEPGVTVTVEPGTTINVVTGASIDVEGTLDVRGEKGNVVTLATAPEEYWLGVSVAGTYTLSYGVQSGGAIITNTAAARVTVTDSELSNALGDFLIMNDGAMDIQFTNLGLAAGDHTHCNIHINGAQSITFTHNTNQGAPYGLMLYAGAGDFRHNNWIGNMYDIEPGATGTGTFDDSYFADGLPAGVTGSTFENLSATQLADTGPR